MLKINCLLLSSLLIFTACAHKEVSKPSQPEEVKPAQPSVEVPSSAFHKAHIVLSASTSKCAQYSWANRGKAPSAYIQGMALVYARAYCKPHPTTIKELGSSEQDALAYYGKKATLKNLYTLMIGLGMRESSGKYCTGRDASASNTSAVSAESGMFQTSYDSAGSTTVLVDFVKEYHSDCFLPVFSEGITCKDSDWKYWGSGIGLDFQKQAKECPAFAAEYAALTLRLKRKHYGPINRKEAEFKQECSDMLTDIEKIIDASPDICKSL